MESIQIPTVGETIVRPNGLTAEVLEVNVKVDVMIRHDEQILPVTDEEGNAVMDHDANGDPISFRTLTVEPMTPTWWNYSQWIGG